MITVANDKYDFDSAVTDVWYHLHDSIAALHKLIEEMPARTSEWRTVHAATQGISSAATMLAHMSNITGNAPSFFGSDAELTEGWIHYREVIDAIVDTTDDKLSTNENADRQYLLEHMIDDIRNTKAPE